MTTGGGLSNELLACVPVRLLVGLCGRYGLGCGAVMLTVGIDPGLDGAVVLLVDGEPVAGFPTPVAKVPSGRSIRTVYDVAGMVALLRDLPQVAWRKGFGEYERPEMVIIEATNARAQGRQACHSLGRSGGLWEGIVATLGWPYQAARPAEWMGVMLRGVPGKGRDKGRSILAAGRLMPGLDLRRSERAKKPHDGIADAGLMALYAYRLISGGET